MGLYSPKRTVMIQKKKILAVRTDFAPSRLDYSAEDSAQRLHFLVMCLVQSPVILSMEHLITNDYCSCLVGPVSGCFSCSSRLCVLQHTPSVGLAMSDSVIAVW